MLGINSTYFPLCIYLYLDVYLSSVFGIQQQIFDRLYINHANIPTQPVLSKLPLSSATMCTVHCLQDNLCSSCLFHNGSCSTYEGYLPHNTATSTSLEYFYFGKPEYPDLARGKPATQSSTLTAWPHCTADKAVDGQGLDSNGVCLTQTHTADYDRTPYWTVDLEATYTILLVRILPAKTDQYIQRLADIDINVGDNPTTFPFTCAYFAGPPAVLREWVDIQCAPGIRGRYVQLQRRYDSTWYHMELCEVEVRGY